MSDKLRAAALLALDALDSNDLRRQLRAALSLRAALAEPAIKESLTVAELHPFEDASVISALSWAATLIEKEYPVGHNGADSWLMYYSDKHGEHIRRSDHREWEKVHGRWKPKAALSEPEQEPVGKFSKFSDGVWKEVTTSSPGQFLYTAPPRREWVGLTGDEIEDLPKDKTWWEIIRAAEEILKDKNT